VIWGQQDHFLGQELAEPDHDDVPNLDRVERLPDASHWSITTRPSASTSCSLTFSRDYDVPLQRIYARTEDRDTVTTWTAGSS